ncbi:MAG: TGS domain-containing protein, partial [Prevotellaceae bacterium]|nr:TGS domain-containing protein [Prevotellaceae bacterium]
MIKITFPDNSIREYQEGTTGLEIAQSISSRFAAEVLSVSVNGKVQDLNRPINVDAQIKLHKFDDDEGKHTFWHSSSHLMAEALQSVYPQVKFGIGPSIENGFYYDVDFGDINLVEADLAAIEEKMLELARTKEHFICRSVS